MNAFGEFIAHLLGITLLSGLVTGIANAGFDQNFNFLVVWVFVALVWAGVWFVGTNGGFDSFDDIF